MNIIPTKSKMEGFRLFKISKMKELIKLTKVFTEAKVVLTHTSNTISEIALKLNFADASHFDKFFNTCAKLTPRQYRKLLNQ